MDYLTIHDLYDEKLLIFNNNKQLIYSSIDDTPIYLSKKLLDKLDDNNRWIETKEGLYDVIGAYVELDGMSYYGISKAYDSYGYSKLNFLKLILFFAFIVITIAILISSFYLSNKITQPLVSVTNKIGQFNFDNEFEPIKTYEKNSEITILAKQFNKLMEKMKEVFAFQKHAIHHISHELKTPISILVSNFEKIENETDIDRVKELIEIQKEDTMSLSDIINSLLEISKAEAGNTALQEILRVDDIIFDVSDELQNLHPNFKFSIEYIQTIDEAGLVIHANSTLLKAAFMDLMMNCIQYSNNNKGEIAISNTEKHVVITFENEGDIISDDEKQFLFQHFFRGKNSKGKSGFGLGLVFINKIISLHGGQVSYQTANENRNIFTVSLPLS